MNLSINRRESHDVAVLDLSGKLVMGEECDTLREHLKQLLAANKKKILLNLGDVIRADSTGIGILVEAVVLTAKDGGRLKLVNVPRLLHNTLRIYKLLPAFEVHDNEDEALASFK